MSLGIDIIRLKSVSYSVSEKLQTKKTALPDNVDALVRLPFNLKHKYMKNLFATFVVLIFSSSGFAQGKVSSEQVRLALAESMVSFVSSVRPAFTAGMSAQEFQNALIGATKPTIEGAALIKKAHEFLFSKTSDASIIQNYSGKEMSNIYGKSEAVKSSKGQVVDKDVFVSSGEFRPYENKSNGTIICRWYDIRCHLIKLYLLVVYGEVPCMVAAMGDHPCH